VSGPVLPVGELLGRGPVSVDLDTPSSALAIGAHPDDVEFGCGATLAKWAAAGCRIWHAVLTDGSKGSWDRDEDTAALVERRHTEQMEAARRLGGGAVVFFDWPDGELEAGAAQRRAVCELLRRIRPQVVLGHDPWRRYRLHPDHRQAGWLVVDAVVAAREARVEPQLGPPHRPSALLLWEADDPNHIERAEEGAGPKLQALLAHRSQYATTLGVSETAEGIEGIADLEARLTRRMAEHGALADPPVARAEAFRLITDL
jgi:LmbE family N-acetylglucosaminyl deacetylase